MKQIRQMKPINYNILGITGKSGFGKDTLANYIASFYAERYPTRTSYKYSFASPLKRGAQAIFNLSDEELWGDEKDVINSFWDMTPREIMQKLSTESIRNVFREDFWIKRAEIAIVPFDEENSLFLISDVRYENEAAWIRQNNGLIIHIRTGPKQNEDMLSDSDKEHISEQPIKFLEKEGDLYIENHKTFADLRSKAEKLVELFLESEREEE
ncbi:hypothetical protein LCGC14_1821460 [marine sediment metagenome]|uniref:Deoxynucleotide monophosphate kinase n=1 Tax=marine sediment metagenome TaxID=412755 RepID=A0A0F9JIA2_9ZZZZ